jgi:hypothetical protein
LDQDATEKIEMSKHSRPATFTPRTAKDFETDPKERLTTANAEQQFSLISKDTMGSTDHLSG